MPLAPNQFTSLAHRQAIGALTHDAGLTVNMFYTPGASGSDTLDTADSLRNVFMYSNAVKGLNSYDNIGAGLIGMVNPNLDAGYPVLLGITGSPGGHAIVCDGYGYIASTLYHHLNMGWSGYENAWYNLPTIDTAIGTFGSVYKCVYNIYVSGGGEIISGRVLNETSAAPVSGAVVTATDSFGGTYTGVTNARGIYAIPKLPSSTTFTLSVSAPGHSYPTMNVATGLSSDYSPVSGNVWAADFGYGVAALKVESVPAGVDITGTHPGNTPYSYAMSAGAAVNLLAPAGAPGNLWFNRWKDAAGNTLAVSRNIAFPFAGTDTTLIAEYGPTQNKGYVIDWGLNTWGQLGDGSRLQQNSPVTIPQFLNAKAIAAGQRHTLVLLSSGAVHAFGGNYSGQLGDGTTTDRDTPVRVPNPPGSVIQLAAGLRHSLALTSEGYVYA